MASSAIASSFSPASDLRRHSLRGCKLKTLEQSFAPFVSKDLSLRTLSAKKSKHATYKGPLTVQASYSGGNGRSGSASVFVGGFILGGVIVGTLGCVFAPQISKALAGADRKDLMRKLPKFIYDEEKALEKTRKVLAEKIAQLNSAIDDVSSQLRADDDPNGAAVVSDEIESAI